MLKKVYNVVSKSLDLEKGERIQQNLNKIKREYDNINIYLS